MDDRPNPTPGDLTNPSGTMLPADLPGTISPKDMEQARQWMRNDLQGSIDLVRSGLLNGLLSSIADAIRGMAPPGLESVAEAMADRLEGLQTLVDEAVERARNVIQEIAAALTPGGGVIPTPEEALGRLRDWGNSIQQEFNDWATRWQNLVQSVTSQAVDAIIDGVSGIGQWASRLSDAIWGFVDRTIHAIFGDGGTKWAQEMLLASAPVTLGFNDLPLGFVLPYPATIQNVIFRTLEHTGTGRIRLHFRVNGVDRNTMNFNAGMEFQQFNVNLNVNMGDVITLWVSEASSDCAMLSCAVWGRYR